MKKLASTGKNVKLSLALATDSVRDKFRKLRSDDLETGRLLEEQFKPITKKLGILKYVKKAEKKKRKKEPHIDSFVSHGGHKVDSGDADAYYDDDDDESEYMDLPDTSQHREEAYESNGDDDLAVTPTPPSLPHSNSLRNSTRKRRKKNIVKRRSQRLVHVSALKKQLERELRSKRLQNRTKKSSFF